MADPAYPLSSLFVVHDHILEGNNLSVTASFDPLHDIFRGHFPGKPIVPGVCIIELIKHLVETFLGRDLRLQGCDQMKFLNPINPTDTTPLQVKLSHRAAKEAGCTHITVSLEARNTVMCKFSGTFSVFSHPLT